MAADVSRYDVHAVQQINRNIELIRYVRFGEDLLLLTLVRVVAARWENDIKDPDPDTEIDELPVEQVKYLEGLFKLGETVDADKPDK